MTERGQAGGQGSREDRWGRLQRRPWGAPVHSTARPTCEGNTPGFASGTWCPPTCPTGQARRGVGGQTEVGHGRSRQPARMFQQDSAQG